MNHPSSPPLRRPWDQIQPWIPDLRLLGALGLLYVALLNLSDGGWWQALLCGTGAAALGWSLLRRFDYHVVGPLFWYEMIRLGRSGWTTWLRCAYAGVLLLTLWLTYENWHRSHGDELFLDGATIATSIDTARLGEHFTTTIIMVQNFAAILLTSLYLSGSIVDERQKRTLDYLLATHLYDHEIILGKLFARLLTVASVLLTGLPVLALIQFWGGVDIRMLTAGFATTLFTLLLIGSMSIFCSTRSRTKLFPILGSHGLYWMFALGFCVPLLGYASSPFFFFTELEGRLRGQVHLWSAFDLISTNPAIAGQETVTLQMILNFAVGQTVLSLFFLRAAIKQLREPLLDDEYLIFAAAESGAAVPPHFRPVSTMAAKESSDASEPLLEKDIHHDAVSASKHPPRHVVKKWYGPALFYHPLWWRETWSRANGCADTTTGLGIIWLFVVFGYCTTLLFSAMLMLWETQSAEITQDLNFPIRALTLLGAGGACCAAAFLGTSNLSHERARRTLESLFMLPIDWWKIFAIKWLAIQWRCVWIGVGLLALWVCSAITPVLSFFAVPLLAAAVLVHVTFFTTLGMWLSLVCKTSMRATLTMGGIMLGLTVGPLIFLQTDRATLNYAVNPLMTWWALAASWNELSWTTCQHLPEEMKSALAGVLCYAILALLLFGHALRRFYAEPARQTD